MCDVCTPLSVYSHVFLESNCVEYHQMVKIIKKQRYQGRRSLGKMSFGKYYRNQAAVRAYTLTQRRARQGSLSGLPSIPYPSVRKGLRGALARARKRISARKRVAAATSRFMQGVFSGRLRPRHR